ncbi:bifunctional Translational (tr)-type GTP-binding domain/Elongation factor EFG [Babesia duncani]|uniref:Translation factor GUF1 homolog, mitochondrial n=1 Tax=Babesia duncani TaxID=323732 RepID=A0AAD9PNP5_9APIC|nr:bifunctional Translational (tr)-type GTP-binding domain/Elongation factor EFG [Babesia duncani]
MGLRFFRAAYYTQLLLIITIYEQGCGIYTGKPQYSRAFLGVSLHHRNDHDNHIRINSSPYHLNTTNTIASSRSTHLYTNENENVAVSDASNLEDDPRIRNFCIIAHVDHGKSTLADRFLEYTKTVAPKDLQEQYLDNMELERERGITIKLQTALIKYTSKINGKSYSINLIDTPGHIDFNHEARRSISACEGAVLVVDGTKGIQAQTITTASIAIEHGLKIIPVINKIDLTHCNYESSAAELMSIFGFEKEKILKASAKQGIGIEDILEAIVQEIPPPKITKDDNFRAVVFDSNYNNHKGVISYVRVVDGIVKRGDDVVLMDANVESKVASLGVLLPELKEMDSLEFVFIHGENEFRSGEVGWICMNIKDPSKSRVGDTIAHKQAVKKKLVTPVNPFEDSQPSIFAGLYPCGDTGFLDLKAALEKLKLNDHSFVYEACESSIAGQGFKCGFNGLLHLDVIVERLNREYNAEVLVTSPSVPYKCILRNGTEELVNDAAQWPQEASIKETHEPWTRVTIHIPAAYVSNSLNSIYRDMGGVMALLEKMRGEFISKTESATGKNLVLIYNMPMIEVISDFFDKLKSLTNGYGSFDYQGINGEEAHGLAVITPKTTAYRTETLCNIIPKRQFKVPIQAALGKRVIAASTIPAIKKNVIERCSGGDPSRKMKLLANQAKGKKMMAEVGNVTIPMDAYKAIAKALRN